MEDLMDGRILPEPFQLAYEQLWARSLGDSGPGAGVGNHPLSGQSGILGRASGKVENAGWRTSSGEADMVGQIAGPKNKQVGKTSRTLKDERAFRFKQKVDKDLRRIAAKINAFQDGRNSELAGQRVCEGRCKKYGEIEWSFCARCGGPMRDLDPQE
jgi:hypothetical protein